MNEKMKGNGVVAKLLFLISVYEFPYTIYLIIIINPHLTTKQGLSMVYLFILQNCK